MSDTTAQSNIPSDIRAKMDGYVGVWDWEEQVKSSPDAEWVAKNGTWEASWVFDHLIQWRGFDADGNLTVPEYEGYDAEKQGYTTFFVSNGARGESFDGVWDGNTITHQSILISADGVRSRNRCTWPYNSDFTAIENYTCETLTDGTWWVWRRGNAKKRDK